MNALSTTWRMMLALLLSIAVQMSDHKPVSAQTAETSPRPFLLGAGSTGSSYHPMGVALSTLIKLKLLPSENIDLTNVNSKGPGQNIDMLRQGDVQFAILPALASYQARKGIGPFLDDGPQDGLRAVTTLWFNADHFIVPKSAMQSGTIKDLAGLRGQAMSFGQPNSAMLQSNQALLESLGLGIDSDFKPVGLDPGASAQALIDGDIAGMSISGGLPVGAVEQIFDALGDEVVVLEFDDKQLAAVDQGRRLWDQVVIPAGTYPGQDRDIFSIGTPNVLAVRADVDDEVVYQITKTIFEELDYLQGLHEVTNQISLDRAVHNLPLPLHDGALRYFEEKGVELPAPPVQLSPDLLARFDNNTQARNAVNNGIISMFTGASGETSARAAGDLAAVLSVKEDGLSLSPTYGGGAGQNLTDLLYRKGVDSAIIRTDAITYAIEQDIYPDVESKVAYITEMFPEEVHLIVRDGIDDIQGLIGRKVNIGAPGSSSDITASIILSKLNIAIQPQTLDTSMALDALKRGDIDGAFVIGGKPIPRLQEIKAGHGLKLLPVPFVQYADNYRPSSLTSLDYPNLMPETEIDNVATQSVRTALFTYLWREGSERYQALSNFSGVFLNHLPELQQDGHHPKWREIDPTAEVLSLRRFKPARDWVESNEALATRITRDGQALIARSLAAPQIVDELEPLQPDLSLDAAATPAVQQGNDDDPAPGNDRPNQDQPEEVQIPPTGETDLSAPPSGAGGVLIPQNDGTDGSSNSDENVGLNEESLSSSQTKLPSIKPTF